MASEEEVEVGPPERGGQVARFFLCPPAPPQAVLVRTLLSVGIAFERSAEGVVVGRVDGVVGRR
jgi:hypothetical protein